MKWPKSLSGLNANLQLRKKPYHCAAPPKKLIYPDSVQKAESLKKKKNVLAMKKRVSLPGPSPNPFLWIVSTMSLFV